MGPLSLKTMIALVGIGGCLLFACLMSYEFIELLTNILYTVILSIIIAFFYQNREQAIMIIFFILNIEYTDPSKTSSPPTSSSSKLSQFNNNNHNTESIKPITNNDTASGQKTEKEIMAGLYEQVKELNLSYFNEKLSHERDKKTLTNKLAVLEQNIHDINNEKNKLKDEIHHSKKRINELTKERDSVSSNEQKLLLKLSDYEKRDRVNQENEKVLQKKINELKDHNHTLRKDSDEKSKRIVKLEDQLAKHTRPSVPVTPITSNIGINGGTVNPSVTSNTPSTTTPANITATISFPQMNGGGGSNNLLSASTSSSSSSTSASSSPSSSSAILHTLTTATQISTASSASTTTQQLQIPVPSSTSSSNGMSGTSPSTLSISPSPSPGTSPSSQLQYINHHQSSSDDETNSNSSNNNSDTPKPFKSLMKKVKNSSSKIINKAQNHLNKHLNTDFFTPPTTTNSPLKPHHHPHHQTSQPSRDDILSTTATITDDISSSTSSLAETLSSVNNKKIIDTSSIPDIFTFEDDGANGSSLKNDLDSSLSDLLQFDNSSLNITTLSSFIDRSQDNDKLSTTLQTTCIKEFSIKESENKAGLRRAKKKPLSGVTGQNMMEDVSFALHPFNDHSELSLFGVFDGHAGREAAKQASLLFPSQVTKYIEQQKDDHPQYDPEKSIDMSDMLKASFASVDDLMKQDEEMQYVGCTATVAFVWSPTSSSSHTTTDNGDECKYLQVANVGDSSAYLCRNGKAVALTFDHKASDPLEKKRMVESGIPVSENQTRINGIAVSRSLGNHFIKDQNIGMIATPHLSQPIKLLPTDSFLIIASDGLWDVISGEQACEIGAELIESRGAQAVASTLLQNALQMHDCKDNVTIIVVKF